jgi:hypothetical protein
MITALIENAGFNRRLRQRTPAGRWERVSEIGPAAM